MFEAFMKIKKSCIKERWYSEYHFGSLFLVSWRDILLKIIIIIIIIISFMQVIYTYIPETNYVPREYRVAAILLLLFLVLISLVSVLDLLYFYISTFRSMLAVPNVALFWSSWTSCFPGMLLTYFLNDFELLLLICWHNSHKANYRDSTGK